MNQLIVNADDFGLTEGVTQAILDCHLAGSVNSTTMMVGMPGSEFAGKAAASHPELGIGLHFTLTLGPPTADPALVSSLLSADGTFPNRSAQERNVMLGRTRVEEIRIELHAQLRRLRALGVEPTHIDSHQHIHVLPRVFDVVAEEAEAQGLPMRMPWRWHGPNKQKPLKRLKGQVLRAMVARNRRKWQGRVPMNSAHCSIFDVEKDASRITIETYRHLLSRPSPALELMVHPGTVDEETRSLINIGEVGPREHSVLSTHSIRDLGLEMGFEYSHFGQLQRR